MKKRLIHRFLPALVLTACLCGCAVPPQPLYSWGSYESQIYAHLNGKSPLEQIEELERDRVRIESSGRAVPPGFYAHLGLLYYEAGDDAGAVFCLEVEKANFPEASSFIDFLLNNYRR